MAMSRKETPGNEPLPPYFDLSDDGIYFSRGDWFCAGMVAAFGLILFGAAAALSVFVLCGCR